MAVVFISPRQRQKMFFMGITIVFLLFLVSISLGVFLAGPKKVSSVLVFNKPKVNIDMRIFDSGQFLDLRPFTEMKMQYSYMAITRANKPKTGFVSAVSIQEARTILQDQGLIILNLKEAEIGRENPFIPYYTPTSPATR